MFMISTLSLSNTSYSSLHAKTAQLSQKCWVEVISSLLFKKVSASYSFWFRITVLGQPDCQVVSQLLIYFVLQKNSKSDKNCQDFVFSDLYCDTVAAEILFYLEHQFNTLSRSAQTLHEICVPQLFYLWTDWNKYSYPNIFLSFSQVNLGLK